ELVVRAFLAESFALHFLEDAFSTGHFVGHWGDDATRLGTHDFYSRAGLEAARWIDPNATFLAHGDAFLTDDEARWAARPARTRGLGVLDAATAAARAAALPRALGGGFGFEGYASCADTSVAPALAVLAAAPAIAGVLRYEPIPEPRSPPVPRVRAEEGF